MELVAVIRQRGNGLCYCVGAEVLSTLNNGQHHSRGEVVVVVLPEPGAADVAAKVSLLRARRVSCARSRRRVRCRLRLCAHAGWRYGAAQRAGRAVASSDGGGGGATKGQRRRASARRRETR